MTATYLPFWQGALLLASVPLLHWLFLRRGLAVSGRLSALVDRVRHGKPEDAGEDAGDAPMSEAELLAAIRAQTAAEFGEGNLEAAPAPEAASPIPSLMLRTPDGWGTHTLFFVGAALGGFVASVGSGTFAPTALVHGELFARYFGSSAVAPLVLFAGGLCVGVGTRMAGGCTSGHGLCGVSQLQKGSLLATAAFFGAGVLTSFVLGALS